MIRVASYCRVSTDHLDQMNSFESQQRYFREYIERHEDWELYDIYADEGATGTSTHKRAEFNRMIHDAISGKFDLILTKEVSRFSRNILDTISYTRELKNLGIGVVFMTDGFSSLDPDAELRLSIMGSIAQEESRKTSERVKWGQERQMERGIVFGTSLLGYVVKNGEIFIEPEGAEIVKLIFYKYGVEKKGTSLIARELRESGYKTFSGNRIWNSAQILKILKNEKYTGDLVQRKTYTPDYLTHSKKTNRGEVEKIVLKSHHEPIISRELWDAVQEEIRRRCRNSQTSSSCSNMYAFSGKIRCGQCGAAFIARKRSRMDGSFYQFWSCSNAARFGKKKVDDSGNEVGCNIGRTVSSKLLLELMKYILNELPVDIQKISENLANLIQEYSSSATGRAGQLNARLKLLQKKKMSAVDAYLSGILQLSDLESVKFDLDQEITRIQSELDRMKLRECGLNQGYSELKQKINDIMSGKLLSESYIKAMLESVKAIDAYNLEIKLTALPTVWRFRLM